MDIIKENFRLLTINQKPNINSIDIMEHMNTLYTYAKECDSVFETGVRGCVSSWAFLYGLLDSNNTTHKRYFLNDVVQCDIQELLDVSKQFDNISVNYEWKSNLILELNDNYDLTFIDTFHVYGQLKRELNKFSQITNKYIIMHDTTVDEIYGEVLRSGWNPQITSNETGLPVEELTIGLWPAVEEFLNENPNWYIKERFYNNNGLTILARKE